MEPVVEGISDKPSAIRRLPSLSTGTNIRLRFTTLTIPDFPSRDRYASSSPELKNFTGGYAPSPPTQEVKK